MPKTTILHQRPVISGAILLLRGGLGEVRRHIAADGTTVVSIVKIDLSDSPNRVPRIIRTNEAALERAIASGEAEVVALPRTTRVAPRRFRRAARRRDDAHLPITVRVGNPPVGRHVLDPRAKVAEERRLLRIDVALRRARRHAGALGVHDQNSARLAMTELRAAGVLFSGDELLAAERASGAGRRGRCG